MVAEGGEQDDRLAGDPMAEALATARRSRQGDFFALVAFLERLTGAGVRVGGDGPAHAEPIRFRHDASLAFSTADVSDIQLGQEVDGRRPLEVTTTFLGLTGAATPSTADFAAELASDAGDDAVSEDLLAVLHHRVLSLFYRSVSRYHYPRELTSDLEDPWSKRILALAGVDTFDGSNEPRLPRWRLLRLAALLVRPDSSAWALETALEDVLEEKLAGTGAGVTIEQFVGDWVPIPAVQQTRLGVDNSSLGLDAVIGQRAFDRTGKFRILIGPLTHDNYRRFQQDPEIARAIAATVDLICHEPLEYDIGLVVPPDAVAALRLSAAPPDATKLGIDTFLGQPTGSEIVLELPRAFDRE